MAFQAVHNIYSISLLGPIVALDIFTFPFHDWRNRVPRVFGFEVVPGVSAQSLQFVHTLPNGFYESVREGCLIRTAAYTGILLCKIVDSAESNTKADFPSHSYGSKIEEITHFVSWLQFKYFDILELRVTIYIALCKAHHSFPPVWVPSSIMARSSSKRMLK